MFIADKAGFLLSIDYGFYPKEDSPIAFVTASYCIQTGRFQIPCVHVRWSRHWCDAFCIRIEVHMVGPKCLLTTSLCARFWPVGATLATRLSVV